MDLNDYQNVVMENIRTSLASGSRMVSIHAPPGWGRTGTQMALVRWVLGDGHRVLWIPLSQARLYHIGHMLLDPEGISWDMLKSWKGPLPNVDTLLSASIPPASGWGEYGARDFLIVEATSGSLDAERLGCVTESWPGVVVWFSFAADGDF